MFNRKFAHNFARLIGIAAWVAAASMTTASAQGIGGKVAVESAAHDRYIVVFNDDVGNPRSTAAALARRHGFDVRMTYSAALKGFAASLPRQGGRRAEP